MPCGSDKIVLQRAAAVADILDECRLWDFAVLNGRARSWSRGLVSASKGLAVMGGGGCGGSGPMSARISLPLAGRLAWRPLSFLGVGVYEFVNINSGRSFAGAVFAIELGRPR